MSGYRGDGYGVYGDHGDDDYYGEMRRDQGAGGRMGRDDDRMRDRDDGWRMRDRDNDWQGRDRGREDDRNRFMLGGRDDDRGRWGDNQDHRDQDRERDRMSSGGDRVQSWVRQHNEDPYHASRQQGRGRDEHRGEGFLERAGHQMQGWMRDDEDGRGSRSPMGLNDRSRQGGGLGMNRGEQRSGGNDPHAHYLSWRERQVAELDRDYDEYCRENEHKFSSDFQSWRQNRQSSQGAGMSDGSPVSGTSAGAGALGNSSSAGGAMGAGGAGAHSGTGSPMATGGEDAGRSTMSGQDESGADDGKGGRTKR